MVSKLTIEMYEGLNLYSCVNFMQLPGCNKFFKYNAAMKTQKIKVINYKKIINIKAYCNVFENILNQIKN